MKQLSVLNWPTISVVVLALKIISPVAQSQEPPADSMIFTNAPASTNLSVTLDSLVAEAVEKNPELKFYEAEIAAAKGGRKQAGTFPNPELSGSAGQKRVSSGGIGAEGLAWSVGLMQPFEWPGRISLRKAIANRDIELAQLGFERFKIALANRMRVLAYDVFAAQEKAETAREVAERFQALREVMVQRDPAGLTPLLETRVIEATELNTQRKASEASLVTQAARLELNQLRGVAPNTPLVIAPPQLSFHRPPDHETLMAQARTNNFEIRSRAVELTQQGFRVALAKNERYPTISAGPGFSEERAGDRERAVTLGISIPVPLWNRNAGNIQTAKARQAQAETSFFVTQREIERKVLEAALRYEAKLQEMNKWRPDAVQHFRDAAELADRHYRLGAVPISTYVELQQQYLEAVDGLLDTKKEALGAAAELELLAGLPLPLVGTGSNEGSK
ncbi:MAG: TolC family protein [Verrucomicrobiota bacterium]|nr:TolC family protein [Verrucomicrobiota bacterium]